MMIVSVIILVSLIPLFQGISLIFKIIEISEEEQEKF